MAGRSTVPAATACSTNSCGYELSFEFDSDALGFLPTSLGMVLLSGGGPTTELLVIDALDNEQTFNLADISLNLSGTSDDRFVGIINHDGIVKFTIRKFDLRQGPNPIRVDHVQYGLTLPEPTALILAISTAAFAGLFRCSRP